MSPKRTPDEIRREAREATLHLIQVRIDNTHKILAEAACLYVTMYLAGDQDAPTIWESRVLTAYREWQAQIQEQQRLLGRLEKFDDPK